MLTLRMTAPATDYVACGYYAYLRHKHRHDNEHGYTGGPVKLSDTAILASVVLTLLAGCTSADEDAQENAAESRQQVETVQVEQRSVAVTRDYAGRVWGLREVEVRGRVEGILQQRRFQEGEEVEQGQTLFTIEPLTFEIAERSARADVNDAAATLRQRAREWERIDPLYEQGNVSQRERDEALSQFELAEAQLEVAEAALAQAQVELSYTEVSAPISGITELEAVAEGSLINPGDLLTRITQQDQVQVRFSVNERDAQQRLSLDPESRAQARILFGREQGTHSDDQTAGVSGRIDFNQSTVSRETGTVQLRAMADNPERQLTPGQFVRVEIVVDYLEDALIVPQSAVNEGPRGAQVFVVDDGQAAIKLVELGPTLDQSIVIRQGLNEGDEVIVAGIVDLQDGSDVEVVKRDGEATN